MRLLIVSALLLCMAAIGCNKKEVLQFASIGQYIPLQAGKSFIYRMDSTIRLPFGTALGTKSFLVKDSVESQFTDAQGNTSFRLFRFITDTAKANPWTYQFTHTVTINAASQQIEHIDGNNFRYVILHDPLSEGFYWKGNSYINTGIDYAYLDGWNYTYRDINKPFTVKKGTFDSTITIVQSDEVTPPGPFNPSFYQQTNYSIEVYAKGVGLIYKEFLHKTWQINPGRWDDDSYGVKLNLADYK